MARASFHVLGVETSSSVCAVAHLKTAGPKARGPASRVLADARVLELEHAGEGSRHSEVIYSLLDGLFRRARSGLEDLSLIAVSAGPGSFTGLRVGMTLAKIFARFGKIPLVGVPSLEAIAAEAAARDRASCYVPTLDAKRGEVYAAIYRPSGRGLKRVRGPWVSTPEALGRGLPRGALVLKDLRPRASFVAAVGLIRFQNHGGVDPGRLVPAYVRRPEAVEKLERKRQRRR